MSLSEVAARMCAGYVVLTTRKGSSKQERNIFRRGACSTMDFSKETTFCASYWSGLRKVTFRSCFRKLAPVFKGARKKYGEAIPATNPITVTLRYEYLASSD
jgi:hypothetical protein